MKRMRLLKATKNKHLLLLSKWIFTLFYYKIQFQLIYFFFPPRPFFLLFGFPPRSGEADPTRGEEKADKLGIAEGVDAAGWGLNRLEGAGLAGRPKVFVTLLGALDIENVDGAGAAIVVVVNPGAGVVGFVNKVEVIDGADD
jgi:hypothetical protein